MQKLLVEKLVVDTSRKTKLCLYNIAGHEICPHQNGNTIKALS